MCSMHDWITKADILAVGTSCEAVASVFDAGPWVPRPGSQEDKMVTKWEMLYKLELLSLMCTSQEPAGTYLPLLTHLSLQLWWWEWPAGEIEINLYGTKYAPSPCVGQAGGEEQKGSKELHLGSSQVNQLSHIAEPTCVTYNSTWHPHRPS